MSIDLEQRRRSQVARQDQLLRRPAEHGPAIDEDGQPIRDSGMAPNALVQLGVPHRVAAATFGSTHRADTQDVKDWWRSSRTGLEHIPLVIVGNRSGRLAAACARSAIMRSMAFGWMHWGDYVQTRLDLINEQDRDVIEAAALERERRRSVYQLLVIEDFTLASLKDFMVDDVMDMLQNRERHELITLITSTEDERDYVMRLEERITPRAPLVRWLQETASWSPDAGQ